VGVAEPATCGDENALAGEPAPGAVLTPVWDTGSVRSVPSSRSGRPWRTSRMRITYLGGRPKYGMFGFLLIPAVNWPATLLVAGAFQVMFLVFGITPTWLPTIVTVGYFAAVILLFAVLIFSAGGNPFL
jgi:hypothetical protein